MKKAILILLMITLTILPVLGEGEDTEIPETNPITIACTPSSLTLNVGESVNIPCTIQNAPANILVSYGSNNASIASIDAKGTITANTKGTTEVYISYENEGETFKEVVKVTVNDNTYSFEFTQKEVYIEKNRLTKLNYKASANIEPNNIVWTSSDNGVVSVNNGEVKGLKPGSATISAKIGDIETSVIVHVSVTLSELYFNSETITIPLNKSVTIPDLIFVPYDTTSSKNVSYTIEDDTIAEIDGNTLKGLKVGETTLKATIDGVVATLNIKVEYEQTETNALLLEFQLEKKADNILTYKLNTLTQTDKKFALLLNSQDVLETMETEKNITVYLNIGELELEKIDSIVISDSITKNMNDRTMTFIFVNQNSEIQFSYKFSNASESSLNLLFNLTQNSVGEMYGSRIDGRSFTLSFKEGLPKKTIFSLSSDYINSKVGQMVFVYPVIDGTLEINGKETKIDDKNIFSIEPNTVNVLTFNPISKSSTDTIIILTLSSLAIVVGGGVIYYFVRSKKNQNKVKIDK